MAKVRVSTRCKNSPIFSDLVSRWPSTPSMCWVSMPTIVSKTSRRASSSTRALSSICPSSLSLAGQSDSRGTSPPNPSSRQRPLPEKPLATGGSAINPGAVALFFRRPCAPPPGRAVRKIVKARAMDESKRKEEAALFDLYAEALGLQMGLPL